MLACVCAVILLGVGTTGSVFADKTLEAEQAVVSSVNINTADVKELAAVLFNIGEVKAEAIVRYREEHGPFTSKEQLLNVKGIGAATVKKNEALITL
jgi:competence protein ComEA